MLLVLVKSRTFHNLTLQGMHSKTPTWQLHFTNCRFSGFTLEDVINKAYTYYSHMTNTVSLNN